MLLCTYNKLEAKKSSQERLLSQEKRDSVCFPESLAVCAASLNRSASRNFSKGLEETILDGVTHESAIVVLCVFLGGGGGGLACVTIMIEQSTGHVQLKIIKLKI